MLAWLKKLFSPRRGMEVEYGHTEAHGPPVVPGGAPTTPYPPAVPLDTPDVPEESGRQP